MGQPRPLFCLFRSFQTNIITIFTTNICGKNVHPVYGARIRTHDFWNVSLFPLPLDQGSRPIFSLRMAPDGLLRKWVLWRWKSPVCQLCLVQLMGLCKGLVVPIAVKSINDFNPRVGHFQHCTYSKDMFYRVCLLLDSKLGNFL